MKLHLGCGKRFLPSYTHIDLSSYPHIDYIHDIKTLPMIKDASVQLIYTSHTLEYFDRIEVGSVLDEWNRVLLHGGLLRLAVPNFSALVDVYKQTNSLDKIIGPLYGRWEVIKDKYIYHKTVYDFISLKRLLQAHGFSNVRIWDWEQVFIGELASYDDYCKAYVPHLDFNHGTHISLNVECDKL